ncbi:uncharacterized protein LOC114745849 [Neltuma alba]|uniref:uncharacterized protein LOC114745849 n=1 Tax=Neltuma alba TaxID=207710 RepID=UPI0010A490D1|nr:uncharacterized protein LOC114745849 [Prosopis alba]XP_028789850.1 uncharacterized protein LOC114745849 [Prosopis alba]XP_028789851.1 uncharacterized protein LOC114745849 [Prosopis alba]XP_028789852.1 uncharacterized protein LOC114745849 [Prosopis alba]
MESAERRASYAANGCFTHDFMMPQNSSDHPSSISETLESDWVSCNSVNDQVNSGGTRHKPNREKLPDMKWWLHVKSNLGEEANYTCQCLNSWEGEVDSYCAGSVDDNVKNGDVQSIKLIDSVSCIGSANLAVEQPWNSSNTCMKNNNYSRMAKIEAALNNDTQLTAKKIDQGEFWFKDEHFVDWDVTDFLTSEQCKKASSDLDSHWIGTEKVGPWWRNAGKDELASLVAQKSLEHIENCDLPQPQIKHFRTPSPYLECPEHDKTLPSSLNEKAKKGSSYVESYTSGTPTSGCSSQDSDRLFSSNQSKDSYSTSKGEPTNSESNSKAQLLEALCHSQTRAREAEKAAQQAYNEKEHILSLFFRQASQLFAYKQWLHLLQLENLCLQLRNKNQPLLRTKQVKNGHRVGKKRKNSNRRNGIRKCAVAFAVGLGLAGAGLLLGWTMGWMFPSI